MPKDKERPAPKITGPTKAGRNALGESLNSWWIDEEVHLEMPHYFHVFTVLGAGAYGTVVAAQIKLEDGMEVVAVKKFRNPFSNVIYAKRTVRELRFLRYLQHDNIVELRTVFCSGATRADIGDVYVVTEVMDTDLSNVLSSSQAISPSHIKFFFYQLLRGLKFIHTARVIHRDLKPKNLLVNKSCDLKICDLGMARLQSGFEGMDAMMTEYVCTRWYRAPEVLCCWAAYSSEVDMWSCGCIFAEMLTRKVLFRGNSTLDQLRRIRQLLGNPTGAEVRKIPNAKARSYLSAQHPIATPPLASVFPEGEESKEQMDILMDMLQFDPDKRRTSERLLEHPYLLELHEEADEPGAKPIEADEFEFERRHIGQYELEEEAFREMLEYHADLKIDYLKQSDYDILSYPLCAGGGGDDAPAADFSADDSTAYKKAERQDDQHTPSGRNPEGVLLDQR